MTEAEKLINRQLDNTQHAKRGGSFDKFNGRRQSRSVESKYDETGLYKLDYPKKRKGA